MVELRPITEGGPQDRVGELAGSSKKVGRFKTAVQINPSEPLPLLTFSPALAEEFTSGAARSLASRRARQKEPPPRTRVRDMVGSPSFADRSNPGRCRLQQADNVPEVPR